MPNAHPSESLTLTTELRRASFEFTVSNRGTAPIRVWTVDNSWGAEMFSIEITSSSHPELKPTLRPNPQVWTANLPQFVEIPPGGQHHVTWLLADLECVDAETIDDREEHLRLRGSLRIPLSAEAIDANVFVGQVFSPPIDSDPPHEWLAAVGQ